MNKNTVALLIGAAGLILTVEGMRAGGSAESRGSITAAGEMLWARADHSATLLKDGRVLLAGGMVKNGEFLKTAELYDPEKRSFVATGEMNVGRVGQAAVLLKDGSVLIVGGWAPNGPIDSAELYDPRTGKFSSLGSMTCKRARPTATLLNDGRVLVAGGGSSDREGVKSAEIFDARTKKFTRTGDMSVARIVHSANLLEDGKVLIAGGMEHGNVTASAEIYDPRTGKFASVGTLKTARYKHTAGELPDGRVLIAGGSDERDGAGTLSTVEIYDPKTEKFSEAPAMKNARYKLPEHAAILKNGDVLVAGGNASGEVYDAKKNAFEAVDGGTGKLQWYLSETVLPGGDVLLAGGYSTNYQSTKQVWMYRVK